MADRSQTSTGLSVYVHVYGGLHKVLTLPVTVLLAKTNYVMFLFKEAIFPWCPLNYFNSNLQCPYKGVFYLNQTFKI